MVQRGRRSGYQNYSISDQMLLCAIADKIEPIGRNMWEEVAALYNAKRSRNSMERDHDSLRRKFKNLYCKPKPMGSNGSISAKLKPIRFAQEIQVRIEQKGGAHESHDGQDGGEDGARLVREVNAALGTAEEDGDGEDSDGSQDLDDEISNDTEDRDDLPDGTEDCTRDFAATEDTDGGVQPPDAQDQDHDRCSLSSNPVGTILTSRGAFDVSLADEVCSSEAEVDEDTDDVAEPVSAHTHTPAEAKDSPENAIDIISTPDFSPQEAISQQQVLSKGTTAAGEVSEEFLYTDFASVPQAFAAGWMRDRLPPSRKPVAVPMQQILRPVSLRTRNPELNLSECSRQANSKTEEKPLQKKKDTGQLTPTSKRTASPTQTAKSSQSSDPNSRPSLIPKSRGVGRPRTNTKKPVRPTLGTPEGPELTRNPARLVEDAEDETKYDKLSTSSNRLGGIDLRVLRDNLGSMNTRKDESRAKRPSASENSVSSSSFMANKRQKGRSRVNQLEREMARAEEKQKESSFNMMQDLIFMRQGTAQRADAEERRRRADREERMEADRLDREEREKARRDELKAAEASQRVQLEIAKQEREEREKRETAKAEENRRQYDERMERERADARQRHEEMLLMLSAMQQGFLGRTETASAPTKDKTI